MQTKAKANSIITHVLQDDGTILFKVKDAGEIVFDQKRVSEANRQRAAVHGFIQRISDGGALSRNSETGKPAAPEDKLARMQMIADHLMSGGVEWALKATGEKKGPDAGLIIMALIRCGIAADADAANGLVDRMAVKRDVDRRAALQIWADSDRVAAAIGQIRAERAKGDADALLTELGDE